ncbi:hypothetical protein DM558_07650 [Entomomonas moraniae]|uniref:DUF5675 domain-containing protein n=1 Tax=Entomomonas moraniae TaxID=2213226 RepID=A0A3S9XE84_9GAMM|nr:DUF5675 family protein [Entomomonas moraniae]AZS50660.1 hypothetical protein DM558_07650 [Entomomonas moraniae]
MKLTLTREQSRDYGTFGTITLPDGKTFYTLELPDKDNKRQVSCIPKGSYQCRIVNSAKFGKVYGVCGVPNRIAILIHAGNYGGDIEKGYRTDIQGCILLGKAKGNLNNQPVVTSSRVALKEFMTDLNNEPFELLIK